MVRINLPDEARQRITMATQRLFADEFDRELSAFQARTLIDFFIRHLGAPVYNQGVEDARAFMRSKLEDLEGEIYEPEEPR